jgi:peptide/nickel transport system ATP-binding protein
MTGIVTGSGRPAAGPAAEGAPDGPAAVLAVEGLTVRYVTPDGEHVTAVDDIDLAVGRGERVAIVGESGSGKSSTGLAVGGFLTHPSIQVTARRLEVEGRPVERRPGDRMPRRTPGMSMVFQDAMTSLDPVWTVGSQLRAVLRSTGGMRRRQADGAAREWLEKVGLRDTARVLAARPYELSGGMRQRAMLALALAGQPRLLIADEPTSALDASLSREVMELMVTLTEETGAALLVISHDIELCQQYSNRMVVMYRGRIVDQGASATIGRTATDPYAKALLTCVPTLDDLALDRLPTLERVRSELVEGER